MDVTPIRRTKRKTDDGDLGAPLAKKRRTEEAEEGDTSGPGLGTSKEMWGEMVTAVRVIGARISDLMRTVSDLKSDFSIMAQATK